MPRIASLSLGIASAVSLGACATPQGEYPSLAVRDVERAEGEFATGEPARLDVPPLDIDLADGLEGRLAALISAAQDAHAEFTDVAPRAERLVAVARGSGIGSDSWAAAQVALAELDSARSRAAVPLGDLDVLYAAARIAAEDSAAIEAARNQVIALVGEEDATLETLRGRMR